MGTERHRDRRARAVLSVRAIDERAVGEDSRVAVRFVRVVEVVFGTVRRAQTRTARVVALLEAIETRAADFTSRVRDGGANAEPSEASDEED